MTTSSKLRRARRGCYRAQVIDHDRGGQRSREQRVQYGNHFVLALYYLSFMKEDCLLSTSVFSIPCMNKGEVDSNKTPPVSHPTTASMGELVAQKDCGESPQSPSVLDNQSSMADTKQRKEILSKDKKKIPKTVAPSYLFGEDSDSHDSDSPETTVPGPPDGAMRRDDLIRSISERLASSQPQYEVPNRPRAYASVTEAASVPRSHFYLPRAVESIQRWLFTTGGESEDMATFLTGYADHVRDLGIPLDRVDVGVMLHQPKVSSYVWKWERGVAFEGREIPHQPSMDEKAIFGEDDPLHILMDTDAPHIRLRAFDHTNPYSLIVLKKLGYEDYFALPIKHKGQVKGAVAWCTKKEGGFEPDHINFLVQSMQCLSTVLRNHTSDLVMSQLVGRLQEEVDHRTVELAKANQELARANRHVINQSQAQLRHFAMMSHEIRTPLNGIIGLCSVLDQSPLNEEQKDIVQTISSSGDLLQRVVDDVLDYSKLAAGRVEIDMQVADLAAILQPVNKSMATKAKQHNITLQTTLSPNLPEKLYCDRRRLQQILYNLLGNAIKFSNPGGFVEFDINAVDTYKGRRLLIKVKDYGKGIARQHLSSLFQPFLQAHGEKSKLYGGTGLGLAITSKLVQALGGIIKVDSELARWTEFNVDLPCESNTPQSSPEAGRQVIRHVKPILMTRQRSDESSQQSTSTAGSDNALLKRKATADDRIDCEESDPRDKRTKAADKQTIQPAMVASVAQGPVASTRPQSVGAGAGIPSKPPVVKEDEGTTPELEAVKVLCAEDNLVNQKLIMRVLKKIGVKVVDLVDNGSRAVAKAKEIDYDLILMDMQMPIMDGLQATKLIKRHRNASGTSPRVVFVSAHALQEIKDQAVEAGAEGFIAKPYNLKQIREVVTTVAKELKQRC